MTTLEFVRLVGARPSAKGWIANCSGHEDKIPSLSICEGQSGRVLIKCHAGCQTAAIVRALGLQVRDLFADSGLTAGGGRHRAKPKLFTVGDLECALQTEVERIVADESERHGCDVRVLVRHRNKARANIERRFDIGLSREAPPWYEVEPHAQDPVWLACVDQAVNEVAAVGGLSLETLRFGIEDLPQTQERVLEIARSLQQSLSKEPAGRWLCVE
jgi:hypothetical protein